MKKSTKAILTGACALALVAALGIAGCSSNNSTDTTQTDNSSATTDNTSTDTTPAEETHEAVTLTVYAANSLTKAMPELQSAYTKTHSWVTFNDGQYKSSGDLVTMLTADPTGADLLITASKGSMDNAETAGLIDSSTRKTLYKNDLVMVVSTDNKDITSLTLDDIATGNYTIGVGDDSVPAGNYANQSLSTVGCFNDPDGKVGADSAGKANGTDAYAGTPVEGKVKTATSVGNVCKTVTSGEAQVGFVYTSDVYRFDGLTIVGTVPADTHKNIIYPGAVCAQSAAADEAADFLNWISTDSEAIKILQEWGFEVA